MTILNIYSLDDTENQNVIACLPEGKHVIGRGNLLKVSDKRVSRKHAVIEVSSDKISLTSVHVNPCFFKAANGKTLSVITENQQSELNDGDQFALLPESCWFKVKIKTEQEANGPINGDSTVEITEKRPHDKIEENELNSDSKRPRLSTSPSHETNIHKEDNVATTSNITLKFTNNVQNIEASHNRPENKDTDAHVEGLDTALIPAEPGIIETKTNEIDNLNREIKEELAENEIVVAPPNTSHNLSENNPNDAIFPEQPIKEEPSNDSNNEEPLPSVDISNEQQPEINTTNTGTDNQNKDEASGSGAQKVRRERCWYGDRCFRKNPNHRETFSHPGNVDYNSDPDDDRPECPFGANCYRKNIEHRRDYKHVGKPAPKPRPRPTTPDSPGSPSTQNQLPNQKKPRKPATKKPKPQYDIDSSQDDYDLEDPFLNDASSDDFEPSDEIDSDSSDYSQEVDESQERKRMIKEAKRFTKKKK